MLRGILAAALLLVVTDARAQSEWPIATGTCGGVAAAMGESVNWRMLGQLYAGHAAGQGAWRFDAAHADVIGRHLHETCGAADAAARPLSAIAAERPLPYGAGTDLAALTCAELALGWRQNARSWVPFLTGATETNLARRSMDRIGEGIPRICRQPGQEGKTLRAVLAELPRD